jgi:uncharacterized protein YgiM (DUF1202 family)
MSRLGSRTSTLATLRRSALATAAALALAAVTPAALAQVPEDQPVKEVENSKFATSGIITSNAVYVRCGPGDNYYPTMKLDKGGKVKVVGAKFDWLKIVPPDGSFCYVARLYVDRHGDGKVGRVNKDAINVRAGSSLSALKIGILCELAQGEEVEILGEEQEYFKIKPPAKAYLYINKKFVEPDPEAKPEAQVAKIEPKPVEPKPATPETPVTDAASPKPEAPKAPETVVQANPQGNPISPPPANGGDFANPETTRTPEATRTAEQPKPEMPKPETPEKPAPNPLTDNTPKPENTRPTDPANLEPAAPKPEPVTEAPKPIETPKVEPKVEQPKPEAPKVVEAPKPDPILTPEQAEAAFDKAETLFGGSRNLPLEQQPVDTLTKQYTAAVKSELLPESLRRVAESRLATLKARQSAQQELAKLQQSQDEARKRQQALAAEQAELQRRIAENHVKVYAAVGTLQPSSLQVGKGGTLFRITDPATGRTVCYLRSNDAKPAAMIGQFVGVSGQLQEDARLGARVVTPKEITPCDPAKVHQNITAQIIPPSLMPKEPAQATTTEPQ